MKVIYHIGLHSTDEDRALRCLLRNDSLLQQRGIVVAQPGRFRPVLREAMIQLKGQPATEEIQDHILEGITEIDAPQRVLFSNDSFLCVPRRAIEGGVLYPLVSERAPWIRNLFPGQPTEFALALRNPATLIPALHARFAAEENFEQYLARLDPEALSWMNMVERLRACVPDARLIVWCNEDSPLIWPDILQALSDLPDPMHLEGINDFIAGLMTEDGFARLESYLDGHPASGVAHWRKIVSAFLDKFALADAVEEEFDLPGWSQERVSILSERYEEDIERIVQMDGIEFLSA